MSDVRPDDAREAPPDDPADAAARGEEVERRERHSTQGGDAAGLHGVDGDAASESGASVPPAEDVDGG